MSGGAEIIIFWHQYVPLPLWWAAAALLTGGGLAFVAARFIAFLLTDDASGEEGDL